jgi:hypothetical protein
MKKLVVARATKFQLWCWGCDMSQPSGKPIYIPPFSSVRLVEWRDHFQLVPVPEVRTIFVYGKIKAGAFRVDP